MKPVWTTGQIVAQLTNWEARWDTSVPVNYTFLLHPYAWLGNSPNFSTFSFLQQQALARHMELISDVANIDFQFVPDNGLPGAASNRRIGFYNVNHQNVPYWGVAKDFDFESPGIPYGTYYAANSAVNLYRANAQGGWSIGESNPRKLMHELLHTLGLDHPGPYNGDTADYESQALFYQDSAQYTVMSYWLAAVTGADHESGGTLYHASTPLLYDVASLQYLYGANMETRTDNTVYGFNSTAGREVFDLSLHPHAVFTIWDAGGNDTLDLSGYATPSRIDLHQGAFSNAGDMTQNLSIAYRAVIENAAGGAGNDVIVANNEGNRLTGGAGGDVFTYLTIGDAQDYSLRSDGKKTLPDQLLDFTSGSDRIDLSAIDAKPGTAANDAFTFLGTGAFTHHEGELRYALIDGRVQIFGDGDGDGIAELHIMTSSATIQAADFIL